ncbi:MAG: hypothetical protein M5U25_16455 [Planctomycetota bacterium]|nr:hypothetical protein [Planctomycetota bacterium]
MLDEEVEEAQECADVARHPVQGHHGQRLNLASLDVRDHFLKLWPIQSFTGHAFLSIQLELPAFTQSAFLLNQTAKQVLLCVKTPILTESLLVRAYARV